MFIAAEPVKCPIIGDGSGAEQVLGVSPDITERKRIELQLRAEVAHVVASEGTSVVGAQAGAVGIMTADRRSFESRSKAASWVGSAFDFTAPRGFDDMGIRGPVTDAQRIAFCQNLWHFACWDKTTQTSGGVVR